MRKYYMVRIVFIMNNVPIMYHNKGPCAYQCQPQSGPRPPPPTGGMHSKVLEIHVITTYSQGGVLSIVIKILGKLKLEKSIELKFIIPY